MAEKAKEIYIAAKSLIPAAISYNLQILPDSLVSGSIILAILLVSQPLLALAGGALFTQMLTNVAGKLLMKFMPNNAELSATKCAEICVPAFSGKAWSRLLSGSPELLWHPIAPSVYLATLGYFLGVGLALLLIYKEEIEAGVIPSWSLIFTTVISLILIVMAVIFRIYHGCDTILGAIGGILAGILIGYLGAVALGYSTNRRATNVWGIPLIRERCAAVFVEN
jgi:hypothetical protein